MIKNKQERKDEVWKLYCKTRDKAWKLYMETLIEAEKLCRETIKAIDEEITK